MARSTANKCKCAMCGIGARCRNFNEDGSKVKIFAVINGDAFIMDSRSRENAEKYAVECGGEVVTYYPANGDC